MASILHIIGQRVFTVTLFADEPARFLPQASLHCGRFRGTTAIHDDRMLRGTIPEQIDEAMEFIRKNLKVDFAFTGQAVSDETWEYPLDALREALVNALCHRDYTLSSNKELRIYDHEMVISNPGGLPSGITLEDLHKPHVSVLRNRGTASILYDMGFIEQWGSRISRMIESCKTYGLPEPEFSDKELFRVLFRKDPFSPEYLETLDLNESQMHAIAYIKQNGSITNKEFRELMHVSDESARRNLIILQDKNIVEQKGRGRNIHYVLRKERSCKAVGD